MQAPPRQHSCQGETCWWRRGGVKISCPAAAQQEGEQQIKSMLFHMLGSLGFLCCSLPPLHMSALLRTGMPARAAQG